MNKKRKIKAFRETRRKIRVALHRNRNHPANLFVAFMIAAHVGAAAACVALTFIFS